MDNSLTLEKHVNSLTKSAFFHLWRIAEIREYLSEDSSAAIVHAFVTCWLDNGNALLYGLPNYLLQHLQSVHNCAARLVSPKPRYARASPILSELHWLALKSRIILKILLLVYKSLNTLAPVYITDLLNYYKPNRNLRWVGQGIPRSNQRNYRGRAFTVAAPKLWNTLPLEIRNSGSIALFKSRTKTFLFRKSSL